MRATLNLKKLILVGGASAFALLAAPLVSDYATSGTIQIVATAQAASDHDHADSGHSGGQGSGHSGAGGTKQGKGGQAGGSGGRGGNKSIDKVLSETEDDSDRPAWAKGNKAANPHIGSSGNKGGTTKKGTDYGDIWVILRNDDGTPVKDGTEVFVCLNAACTVTVKTVDGALPEDPAAYPTGYSSANVIPVEFGRMNVARAPSKVLLHSLDEALSKVSGDTLDTSITVQILSDGTLVTYNAATKTWVAVTDTTKVFTDAIGRLVYFDGVVWKTIDSPLENLALYQDLLSTPAVDGFVTLTEVVTVDGKDTAVSFKVPATQVLDLAASLIAAASDKTGDLTVDEIVNISKFLGVDDELAALVGSYVYNPTYTGTVVQVLVPTSSTTFELKDVDLGTLTYNVVPTVAVPNVGIEEFAQAADDAVTIFEYVHDNSAP